VRYSVCVALSESFISRKQANTYDIGDMRARPRLGWLMAEGAWERTQEFVIQSRVSRQMYSKRYSGMNAGDNELRVPNNSRRAC
jgi:hypothetical protein